MKKEDSAASVVKSDALDSSVNTLGLLSTSMKEATNQRPVFRSCDHSQPIRAA